MPRLPTSHLLAAAIAGAWPIGCTNPRPPAPPTELLAMKIVNARIWTGDPAQPWVEALAVQGDTISRVGASREIAPLDATRTIDAGGRLVVPGFIDSHVHFLEGGHRLASVILRQAHSRADFVEALRAFAQHVPRGTWITGGDWDHENWGGELPTRHWIDAVTPLHPVWVHRLDGHMALANAAALRAAGVTRQTRDVEGGTIVRDEAGEPTGLLKDNARALVDRHVPAPSADTLDRALAAAMRHVGERGVTSVHHMGTWDDLDVFTRARSSRALKTRVYAAVPLASWERLADAVTTRRFGGDNGRGDDWLKVGMLKGFVDGSLGSHTAAFFDPFTDAPRDRGLFVNSRADLERWIAGADAAGLHVAVHAIGDRANHDLLDIYEATARAHGPRDRRFRIEHAQHLAPRDIPRFAALGVTASMQPYHAADDGRWADRVIGAARAKTTYAFRTLLDSKARLAFGSDWFVAPPTPIEGIHAAVTRQTLDGRHPDGWVPEQKISVEDALRAYTVDAAAAEFGEGRKGRLVAGLLADFVVLDRNLLTIPASDLKSARVDLTVVGGQVVFER